MSHLGDIAGRSNRDNGSSARHDGRNIAREVVVIMCHHEVARPTRHGTDGGVGDLLQVRCQCSEGGGLGSVGRERGNELGQSHTRAHLQARALQGDRLQLGELRDVNAHGRVLVLVHAGRRVAKDKHVAVGDGACGKEEHRFEHRYGASDMSKKCEQRCLSLSLSQVFIFGLYLCLALVSLFPLSSPSLSVLLSFFPALFSVCVSPSCLFPSPSLRIA